MEESIKKMVIDSDSSIGEVKDIKDIDEEKYSAIELEDIIQKFEGIRCIIRTDAYKHQFKKYQYDRKTSDDTTIDTWYKNRLLPIIGEEVEFEVIRGDGSKALRINTFHTVKESYACN